MRDERGRGRGIIDDEFRGWWQIEASQKLPRNVTHSQRWDGRENLGGKTVRWSFARLEEIRGVGGQEADLGESSELVKPWLQPLSRVFHRTWPWTWGKSWEAPAWHGCPPPPLAAPAFFQAPPGSSTCRRWFLLFPSSPSYLSPGFSCPATSLYSGSRAVPLSLSFPLANHRLDSLYLLFLVSLEFFFFFKAPFS